MEKYFLLSLNAQRVLLWWCIWFTVLNALCWLFLLNMVPPPAATLSAAEVAGFYREHNTEIRVGAMLTSWGSAFMVPLSIVIGFQMARLEKGAPIWSVTQVAGGVMMSIFQVLPPIFWGVAAFSPERPAEITKIMHELGVLMLTTTDQYYIFMFVAIGVLSLKVKGDEYWPFPRWFGYVTLWAAFFFEAGAISFLPKTGPFAWDGLFVFWIPLGLYFPWVVLACWMCLRAISRQQAAGHLPKLAP